MLIHANTHADCGSLPLFALEQPPARNYQISQNLPQFNLCKLKVPPKSNLMDIFMFRIMRGI